MKASKWLMKMGVIGLVLWCAGGGPVVAAEEPGTANSRLPIRKVVLYKHGVGYFERQGSVTGDETVHLYFKTEQMNDLLKSLTAIDQGDGQVTSIVYDSTKTIEQLLSDYTFDLSGAAGLPEVLDQLKGSEIELVRGAETLRGVILSLEERMIQKEQTEWPVFYLSVMEPDGRISNINLDEIRSLRFLDERLNRDVQRYLQTLFQQHRRDEKTLAIRSRGQGQRQLQVGYVTETPVWKATYRIVLPGEEEQAKPFLQGWAVVDNVSEEDWREVELSLVSGLPISFVQNLYDPIFKKRPVVQVAEEAAMAPSVPERGMAPMAASAEARVAGRAGREKLAAGVELEGFAYGQDMAGMPLLGDELRRLQAETVTREVGDLFEYKIDHPVTIERNRSALLPIVAETTEGQAVDLYNESTRSKNPLSAVRLKNTTSLTLEGGPLTVFQGDSYVGEALIETVKTEEQRYITYAVDLGLHVNTEHDSQSEQVDHVIINRGTLRMHRAVIETKSYNLDNKDDREKTVVIEHPYRQDWKLLNTETPIEVTDNFKRFEVNVPARKPTKFAVREQRDDWETLAVGNITPDDILVFVQRKYLSDASRQHLERIVQLKAEIAATEHNLETLQAERQGIFEDQQRLRQNLQSLGQTEEEKTLRSRYISQLTQQENRLADIDGQLKQLQQQLREKQKQLDAMIEELEQDLRL